jgi:membrane protease YdiL (CAAX protease family)
LLFALALVLLLVVGTLTQRFIYYGPGRAYKELLGPLGIAITEVLAILLPSILYLRMRAVRGEAVPFMALSVPASRRLQLLGGLVGGVLFGVGFFYILSVFIEPFLEHFIPVPPEERAHLLSLLHPKSGLRPLWQDLLCFAAVPAFCEELLFRGALLSTLGARWESPGADGALDDGAATSGGSPFRWPNVRAVLLSAILFGAFHLSYSKVIPTGLLGLGFGAAAVLGRSLWAAIFMHFTNNALVVVLVRAGFEEAPAAIQSLPYFVAALAMLVIGYLLLRRAGANSAVKTQAANPDPSSVPPSDS